MSYDYQVIINSGLCEEDRIKFNLQESHYNHNSNEFFIIMNSGNSFIEFATIKRNNKIIYEFIADEMYTCPLYFKFEHMNFSDMFLMDTYKTIFESQNFNYDQSTSDIFSFDDLENELNTLVKKCTKVSNFVSYVHGIDPTKIDEYFNTLN